jgi:tRNA wybutosine-synthesizing protein 1
MRTIDNKRLKKIVEDLDRKKYRCFNTSSVQICLWTKKAIKKEGVCYKQKFYGVDCKRCLQFTPFIFCQQNCIHCWRPKELLITNIKEIENLKQEEPEEILKNLIEKRKELLIGFKGNKKVDEKILEKAFEPAHFAISLVGDPLLYKKLPRMIKILKNKYKAKSIFVVTNCQEPEALKKLIKSNSLPTQLYLSINATNKNQFLKLNKPLYKDFWERFLKFLRIAKKAKCRKVIRYTLIKNINDSNKNALELSKLVRLVEPDFIEIKSYMYLGYSTLRLKIDNMNSMEDVRKFSAKLLEFLKNFSYEDEDKPSRIVLLKNRESKYENMIESYKNYEY